MTTLPPGPPHQSISECHEMRGVLQSAASMSTEPSRLSELEEARGLLESVSYLDGLTVARFAWGSVAFPEEMCEELAGLVGKTVAVLRLDGRYYVRAV